MLTGELSWFESFGYGLVCGAMWLMGSRWGLAAPGLVSLRIQTDEVSSTTAAAAAAATYDERLGKRTKSASGAGSGSGNGTSVSNERYVAPFFWRVGFQSL